MQQAVYILLPALFISMVLVRPLARLAGPLGLTDRPGARKIHHQPIPRSGGIAIVIGALTPILFLVTPRPDVLAFLIAAGVLFVFGVLDDRFDLDYRAKLLGQISAATIVTLGGGVLIDSLPFLEVDVLPLAISLPLTIFVIVAITNAVNLSDGLDGLAGGISLLALSCLSVLAYQNGDPAALGIALAMIGSTFGFLRFNSNPAQIFMGDTGSQFLGFGTAVLIILITQRFDTAYGPLIALLIVGIPILDTATVMIRRIRAGLSPFRPDRSHLHHRLLSLGWTQYQAVVFIYVIQALMVLAAYLMRFAWDLTVLTVYLAGSSALLWLVHGLLLRVDRRALTEPTSTKAHHRLRIGIHSRWILDKIDGATELLGRIPSPMLRILVPATLLVSAILAADVGTDISWLAGFALLGLIIALLSHSAMGYWLERLAAYVTVSTVWFLSADPLQSLVDASLLLAFFLMIGFITWAHIRSAAEFRTSTLDVLILILVCLVPMSTGTWSGHYLMLMLPCIVLFYAIEVLLAERQGRWDLLHLSIVVSLLVVLVKGVWP